jgi:phage FluMu protein gp41
MSTQQITGTLKHGLTLAGAVQKDFVLREALAEDYFAAEDETSATKPTTYRTAVVARQLVRLGTYEGPFTLSMLGKLRGADLSILMDKQKELDALGEAEQSG